MRFLIASLVLLATPALAQERMFTLSVTESQLNYIGKVLGKQTYEDAAPVIDAIKMQVGAQQHQAAEDADKQRRDAAAEIERLKGELAKQPSGDQK